MSLHEYKKKQTATGYRPASGFIYMRVYHTARANPVRKTYKTLDVMGSTYNTSKENVHAQAPCKFLLRHGCIVAILRAHRE